MSLRTIRLSENLFVDVERLPAGTFATRIHLDDCHTRLGMDCNCVCEHSQFVDADGIYRHLQELSGIEEEQTGELIRQVIQQLESDAI